MLPSSCVYMRSTSLPSASMSILTTVNGVGCEQEGGTSGENSIPMSSDWPTSVLQFEGAAAVRCMTVGRFGCCVGAHEFPKGAPRNRPFYWDIAKASLCIVSLTAEPSTCVQGLYHERDRDWGAEPERVVQQLIQRRCPDQTSQ